MMVSGRYSPRIPAENGPGTKNEQPRPGGVSIDGIPMGPGAIPQVADAQAWIPNGQDSIITQKPFCSELTSGHILYKIYYKKMLMS